MSEYQRLVRDEARRFLDQVKSQFEGDAGEHGGGSATPNLAKWLDRTRKLSDHVSSAAKAWDRVKIEMIRSSSRNAVAYGDPRDSAYGAFIKDLLLELKKLRKSAAN
ncbi:MAG: hypothetical protein L0Z55_12330 [Planctomycetes bacterium]|nr:hypothetical protein [Planctomycetota bacterium]